MAENPWVKRPYTAADANGVIYIWLKSHAHSSFGRARGAQHDGTDEERAYWSEHRPVVLRCIEYGETVVLADTDCPEVIWAFACTRGDTVHYVAVKRRFKDEAEAMFRDLLGDRLDRAVTYTHDLTGTGLSVPRAWKFNPYAAAPEIL